MKRTTIILIATIFLTFSGCIGTKIYLGGDKREITDDTPIDRAIDPTSIPAGGTWGSIRTILNTNLSNINGTLDSVEVTLAEYGDSITNYSADIQLRLLKSDTASMLGNYTRNGELNSALAAKVNVSDTASMLANYALTSELGDAGTSIGDVRDEIADSLNVLRPLYVAVADTAAMLNPYAKLTDLSEGGIGIGAVQEEIADSLNVLRAAVTVGNGTKAPYFDGSQDGGQILYFYGDNGFYTALQGGAPTANRSYRLPIAALPSAGHKAYLNIDQYGNMGFIDTTLVGGADSSIYATRYFTGQTYALASALSTLSTRTDSIVDVLADTANLETVLQVDLDTDTLATKAYARSVGVGITLNSGTITLNGSEGTADDITFYTNGNGSYDLPAGGGNLTIMSQVQGWINDSLDVFRPLYVEVADTATMLANYALLSEISEVSIDSLNLNGGSLTLTGDDKLTFETNGNASYSLPAGGGNLTIQSQVQGWINDSLDKAKVDIRKFDSDTIPLFVFGLGSGHSADTALFNNGRLAGAFYNSGSDTLYVTELRGVLVEGTGTETIDVQVSWHTNMKDSSAINLNTTALTINNTTTGTSDTSFNNNGIPPGRWVWCVLSGASSGNKPTALMLTMTGYRRNRSY